MKRIIRITSIILPVIFLLESLTYSGSATDEKSFKITEYNKFKYISINEFTDKLDIHNSYDIITGKGRLLYKGSVAVYQVNLSVMLLNNNLVKTENPVIKINGEVFLPLQFFLRFINEFYNDYAYNETEYSIILKKKTVNKQIASIEKSNKDKPSSTKDRISFIIIDPGHGGKDPGAIGKGGIKEKVITLQIAKFLNDYLQSELKNIRVKLTRNSDVFIELADRTETANQKLKKNQNGLFVSIHVNASISHNASGFETYILSQNASNEEARATAALENNVIILEESHKQKRYNDIEHVEALMITSQIQKESNLLANCIQKNMDNLISESVSKGVKKADFFVLRGSLMPAVLVEVGYISNVKEAARLSKTTYQKVIAKGIGKGILQFLDEYNRNIRGTND